MALALVVTARRMRPYFLSHPIGVKINTPLQQTLGKSDTSGRLVEWAMERANMTSCHAPDPGSRHGHATKSIALVA
ncbi:UNVERIFIED_CONTAM: hypothetical protein Sradi_0766600 [Sesamum radiatum]|uniref:Uncharacterized protein n=1 Tax=Sesamum radiatum TaxID=300843 RepID=A0AAW2VQN5_SESRA